MLAKRPPESAGRPDRPVAREGRLRHLPPEAAQYKAGLSSLAGIVVDYGTADEYPWIPQGSHYSVGLLRGAGIAVVESTFNGGHSDQLGDRLVNHMLPFMIEKPAAS